MKDKLREVDETRLFVIQLGLTPLVWIYLDMTMAKLADSLFRSAYISLATRPTFSLRYVF